MTADVVVDTGVVLTVKFALDVPAVMVTDGEERVAAVLPLLSATVMSDGAFAFRVTVPALELPPMTEVGVRVTL